MENKIKLKLSTYGIVSAASYVYLVLADNPGISVPLFFLIQAVSLYLVLKNQGEVKDIRGMILMVPIFIISLNRFISTGRMWGGINFLAVVFLYSVMFLMLSGNLELVKINIRGILKIIVNIFEPFMNFIVPFRWIAERSKDKEKNILIKRILTGIGISLPCVFFLVSMLASADMVFNEGVISFNNWVVNLLDIFQLIKVAIGIFAGLYLFGHLYAVFCENEKPLVVLAGDDITSAHVIKGDVIVINILTASVLAVYTLFIAIQFRYLFSSGELPYGLNYAEYARRGFFELVFLSVLNIALILAAIFLLRDKIYAEKSKGALFTKTMLVYLCVITGVLLVSSFYRMSLYDSAYGFTRLRILVNMFLVFEAVGLLATLVYILKHSFNILLVYAAIGLCYYMTVNVVKIDKIIAEKNVDMYFAGQVESLDINYLTRLSADVVPEMIRLIDDAEDEARYRAIRYLDDITQMYENRTKNWQSYNLSAEKNIELLEANKELIQKMKGEDFYNKIYIYE